MFAQIMGPDSDGRYLASISRSQGENIKTLSCWLDSVRNATLFIERMSAVSDDNFRVYGEVAHDAVAGKMPGVQE